MNASTLAEEEAVRKVEDAVASALDHNDAAALESLWASDYVFINPFGIVLNRQQRVDMVRSGTLRLESYSRDEETIRIYGTTAIVTYRSAVEGHRATEDISSHRRVMTVLLKRDGRWQVVAQQSTRIVTQPQK